MSIFDLKSDVATVLSAHHFLYGVKFFAIRKYFWQSLITFYSLYAAVVRRLLRPASS